MESVTEHTVVEVQFYIAGSNVRCHGDNRCRFRPPNYTASRYTIEMWHDNVHQDQIVLCAFLDLVDCLKAIALRKKN